MGSTMKDLSLIRIQVDSSIGVATVGFREPNTCCAFGVSPI